MPRDRKPQTFKLGINTPGFATFFWPLLTEFEFLAGWEDANLLFLYRVIVSPCRGEEYCLTLRGDEAGTNLSLLTFQTNLWGWILSQRIQKQHPPADNVEKLSPPSRWQESTPVSTPTLESFRQQFAEELQWTSADEYGCIDGEGPLICLSKVRGQAIVTTISHRDVDSPSSRLDRALRALAKECLADARSVKALEQ